MPGASRFRKTEADGALFGRWEAAVEFGLDFTNPSSEPAGRQRYGIAVQGLPDCRGRRVDVAIDWGFGGELGGAARVLLG